MERLPERLSYIICNSFISVSFVAWLTTHCTGKNCNYYIKSCTFYRPDKLFSRVHFLIQNLFIGDQQANLNYLQGNLIQDSSYVNCLLKTCSQRVPLKITLFKQLFSILNRWRYTPRITRSLRQYIKTLKIVKLTDQNKMIYRTWIFQNYKFFQKM